MNVFGVGRVMYCTRMNLLPLCFLSTIHGAIMYRVLMDKQLRGKQTSCIHQIRIVDPLTFPVHEVRGGLTTQGI